MARNSVMSSYYELIIIRQLKSLKFQRQGISNTCSWFFYSFIQKQLFKGFLSKRCSENMKQIYRRTFMPKCDFNKVASQLYWNHVSAWAVSCKFAAYFQNTFSQNTFRWLLLPITYLVERDKKVSKKCTSQNSIETG